MREQTFDFERWDRSEGTWFRKAGSMLPYTIGVLLILAIAYFVYDQLNSVRGVKVEAPSPLLVSMVPPPPPPPPPPEPEPEPPEPTEQPDPTPNPETPKAEPEPAAAPMTINAPAQPGAGAIVAGSGGGIGSPGSAGTCLGTNCGAGTGGGGMSDAFYRRYLSSALQERVQDSDRVNRLIFSADFAITVTASGTVSAARLVRSSGRDERDAELAAILLRVRGLDAPPSSMRFPQRITVRGRRAL
jgi:hypothetical protein